MKNKFILKLLFIILSIFMTACIHDLTEDVRPQKITVSGYVKIDEDGIGVGQPAKAVTDVEEFFVVFAAGIEAQSITSDINDIDYVSNYESGSGSAKLPEGVKLYTDDDSEATYSDGGEFLIEISADATTIWAGVPGENYDVAFVDVQGKLVVGEALSEIDGEDIEIILTPRESGKVTFWLGPDDISSGGTAVADADGKVYVKGPAIGSWSTTILMTESSENSGYYYYEASNVPGTYEYGYHIGPYTSGDSWYAAQRGDSLYYGSGFSSTNATAIFTGESTGENYSPSINSIVLGDSADYLVKASGTTFTIEASVEAKYLDLSNPISTVTADLSSLGLSSSVELKILETSTYSTSVLSLGTNLTSGDYDITITAKDRAGTTASVSETIKVTSKPTISNVTLSGSPSGSGETVLVGDLTTLSISAEISEEAGENITEVIATLADGIEIILLDDGINGDTTADDGIYTNNITQVYFNTSGDHTVTISATNSENETVTTEEKISAYTEEQGGLTINFINTPSAYRDATIYLQGEVGSDLEVAIDSSGSGSITFTATEMKSVDLSSWTDDGFVNFKMTSTNDADKWNNLVGSSSGFGGGNTVKASGTAEIDLSVDDDTDKDE